MIIGHSQQWEKLKKAAKKENLPHTLVFSGQEKLGKKTIAFKLTKIVQKKDNNLKQNSDFFLIEPENEKITIDKIRNLQKKLALTTSNSPYKIAIVDRAHLMNKEAQNCFLKTLEEPKGATIIILITEYPKELLPTILSRAHQVKFYPVPKEKIESYLKENGFPQNKIDKVVDYSLGRPGEAINFLENPKKLKERREKIKTLNQIMLAKAPLAKGFKYIEKISKKKDKAKIREYLEIWIRYFRYQLIEELNEDSSKKIVNKIKNKIQQTRKTNYIISSTNTNSRLALENLLIKIKESV
ncbi:MAG: hypothetical protein ACOC1P_01310 [Minisyncoccales bacterium]